MLLNAALRRSLLLPLTLVAASGAYAQTWRSSVDSSGNQGTSMSGPPSISEDGRFTAFATLSSNLVPGDTNFAWDVFVRDRQTATTTRISVATGGAQANSDSLAPSISDDGRYVAFESDASNLVAGDTNGVRDVFLHDRDNGTTILVSRDSSGNLGNGNSGNPSISRDGQKIAFESLANNFTSADLNGVQDIFVRDWVSGFTELASVNAGGRSANGLSRHADLNTDGRYVVFASEGSDFGVPDTNLKRDIYRRDLIAGVTMMISVRGAAQGDGDSDYPAISGDGQVVVYDSESNNLAGDTNGGHDVFRRDATGSSLTIVSLDSNGTQPFGANRHPDINKSGDLVSFTTWSSDMVPGDTNGEEDIMVRQLSTGITTRKSLTDLDAESNGRSDWSSLSADGKYVSFNSDASNLVPGDTNGNTDVFMRGKSLLLSYKPKLLREFDPFEIDIYHGIPGDPLMLLTTDVGGVPFVRVLFIGKFDAQGKWSLAGVTPPGYSGLRITHVALGKNIIGDFQVTDPVTVSLL